MIQTKALCILLFPLFFTPILESISPLQDDGGNLNVCHIPDAFTVSDPLYEVELRVEKSVEDVYFLIATIEFFNGGYTASPLSNNNFTGLFTLDLAVHPSIKLDENIDESPRSVESIVPHSNTPVNWLTQKTTYRRVLHLEAKENFDVGGKATFTIEPKCTFEEIPFLIKNRAGVLSIEKWGC